MKHHLRTAKTCLNCGTPVPDRYCPHCGQENIEPKEKTSHLLRHFFEDITHYDSKLFITLRRLLFNPGYLTKEYLAGRRASYLNPVRMYVFISFLFFLVLFLNKGAEDQKDETGIDLVARNKVYLQLADSLHKAAKITPLNNLQDSIKAQTLTNIALWLDSIALHKSDNESIGFNFGNKGIAFVLEENKYSRIAEYDSVQNALPANEKDEGFFRWMIRTNVRLKEQYGNRSTVVVKENFNHSVPKLMFLLLPLFALFIKWFHSRKKYYYAQHIIFSIHFHSFLFLLLLLEGLLLLLLPDGLAASIIQYGCLLLFFLYLVMTLKNAYGQSIWMALIKAFSVTLLYIISLIICIVLLAVIIFFTA